MCSCTASGYFAWNDFENILLVDDDTDGELDDDEGDDLEDGVTFFLILGVTLDPTCTKLNWMCPCKLLRMCVGVHKFFIRYLRCFALSKFFLQLMHSKHITCNNVCFCMTLQMFFAIGDNHIAHICTFCPFDHNLLCELFYKLYSPGP